MPADAPVTIASGRGSGVMVQFPPNIKRSHGWNYPTVITEQVLCQLKYRQDLACSRRARPRQAQAPSVRAPCGAYSHTENFGSHGETEVGSRPEPDKDTGDDISLVPRKRSPGEVLVRSRARASQSLG